VTLGTPPVTDEPRTSDGCDACDGCLHFLYRHLPTLLSFPRGVGVSIGDFFNNPSNTSHPSLVRERSVTDVSPCVTEPLSQGSPAAAPAFTALTASGLWCPTCGTNVSFRALTQLDGTEIYLCNTCDTEVGRKSPPVPGSNGLHKPDGGSLAVPTSSGEEDAYSGEDEALWPEESSAPDLPLKDPPPGQACPECGRNIWHQRLTYRECQHCKYKDGLTPQEIFNEEEARM
jgi:hypothetical protein